MSDCPHTFDYKRGALERCPCCGEVNRSLAPVEGSALLDKLERDLAAIKNYALESGAGDPPEGYEQLAPESDALRIADECWHGGMDAMETAISNWIYDQRHNEPNDQADRCKP